MRFVSVIAVVRPAPYFYTSVSISAPSVYGPFADCDSFFCPVGQ
jgi:hypothetical protein